MDTNTIPHKRVVHHGRNIKRLREMFDIKQETIAAELDVTQPYISELEQKEIIDDKILEKIAKVIGVSVDAIKNMNDEAVYNYINTFNDAVTNHGTFTMNNPYNCTFNPIDKIVELYERLLKLEQDKNQSIKK